MLANNFFRDHGLVYQVEKIYLYHVDLREPSMKELRGMYNNTNFNDTELRNIIEGQIGSFELLFRKYYQVLCHYCMGILDDAKKTEDVVQDTFVYLWENRRKINIKTSLKSYLYQSVRHGALKVIRSRALEQRHLPYLTEFIKYLERSEFSEDELDRLREVEQAIDELPPSCKNVFLMSVVDRKSYKEIAGELGISLNTVKTQVSKAYRLIRGKVRDRKSLFLFIWLRVIRSW